MKVRLAIAAAVLALGVSAFTPTPAAAALPGGFVFFTGGVLGSFEIPFCPPPPTDYRGHQLSPAAPAPAPGCGRVLPPPSRGANGASAP